MAERNDIERDYTERERCELLAQIERVVDWAGELERLGDRLRANEISPDEAVRLLNTMVDQADRLLEIEADQADRGAG